MKICTCSLFQTKLNLQKCDSKQLCCSTSGPVFCNFTSSEFPKKGIPVHLAENGELIEENMNFATILGEFKIGLALCASDSQDPNNTLSVTGVVNSSYSQTFISYPQIFHFKFALVFLFIYLSAFLFFLRAQAKANLESNIYLNLVLLFAFCSWFEYSFSCLNFSSMTHNGRNIVLFAAAANIIADVKVLSAVYFFMLAITCKELVQDRIAEKNKIHFQKGFYPFAISYIAFRALVYGQIGSEFTRKLCLCLNFLTVIYCSWTVLSRCALIVKSAKQIGIERHTV